MNRKNCVAALSAILAAVFYAINIPASKILLGSIEPVMMAAVLYLGAGIGVGIIYMARKNRETAQNSSLNRSDLPYVLGMILLDIAAPICLMYGLGATTAANASLLNNFEIAATAVIALVIFKEAVSVRLWAGIALITISSMILSFEDMSSLQFSWGSAFVLLAAVCWGFENNCTRKISSKNTYQIIMLKGIFSGLGSFTIAMITGEPLPDIGLVLIVLALGFVSYGLSIFFYIRAQSRLGARILCHRAVCGGIFIVCMSARDAVCKLFHSPCNNAGRLGIGCRRYDYCKSYSYTHTYCDSHSRRQYPYAYNRTFAWSQAYDRRQRARAYAQ